jgi:hypothetical protein
MEKTEVSFATHILLFIQVQYTQTMPGTSAITILHIKAFWHHLITQGLASANVWPSK